MEEIGRILVERKLDVLGLNESRLGGEGRDKVMDCEKKSENTNEVWASGRS